MALYMGSSNTGTELMESLLLNQYQNSKNLKEYFGCYFKEMDFLFEQIESVYFGRLIEFAEGAQLDIIGKILNQKRSVVLPTQWFGLSDNGVPPTNVLGMADENIPFAGGLFKDESQGTDPTAPLSDTKYRRLLLAKAHIMNNDVSDLNLLYSVAIIILGRVPPYMKVLEPLPSTVVMYMDSNNVTTEEISLLEYFADKYLIPSGVTFNVELRNLKLRPHFNGTDNYILKDTGVDTIAFKQGAYVTFKTKGIAIGSNAMSIIGNTTREDGLSLSSDGVTLKLCIGNETTDNLYEWDIPVVDLEGNGVDFDNILLWKVWLGEDKAGVSINGIDYISTTVSAGEMQINTIGYSDSTAEGFIWDITHTGDVGDTKLSKLPMTEGEGSVVTAEGINKGQTWTIQATPDWKQI